MTNSSFAPAPCATNKLVAASQRGHGGTEVDGGCRYADGCATVTERRANKQARPRPFPKPTHRPWTFPGCCICTPTHRKDLQWGVQGNASGRGCEFAACPLRMCCNSTLISALLVHVPQCPPKLTLACSPIQRRDSKLRSLLLAMSTSAWAFQAFSLSLATPQAPPPLLQPQLAQFG